MLSCACLSIRPQINTSDFNIDQVPTHWCRVTRHIVEEAQSTRLSLFSFFDTRQGIFSRSFELNAIVDGLTITETRSELAKQDKWKETGTRSYLSEMSWCHQTGVCPALCSRTGNTQRGEEVEDYLHASGPHRCEEGLGCVKKVLEGA